MRALRRFFSFKSASHPRYDAFLHLPARHIAVLTPYSGDHTFSIASVECGFCMLFQDICLASNTFLISGTHVFPHSIVPCFTLGLSVSKLLAFHGSNASLSSLSTIYAEYTAISGHLRSMMKLRTCARTREGVACYAYAINAIQESFCSRLCRKCGRLWCFCDVSPVRHEACQQIPCRIGDRNVMLSFYKLTS